jgi:hypothetical protein
MSMASTHLVQVFLPIRDNHGKPFDSGSFDTVRKELLDRFGGVTVYRRSPGEGIWKDPTGATSRDDILIFEVMSPEIERHWWRDYRRVLEARFRQEHVLARAWKVEEI